MSEKKRILVVDDEPDFCSIVQGQLEKEGFEVELAYNGVEGLEKTHANPPDAIVLDVMMPEMDGYEMCKELKADQEYTDIPVLLLTAVAENVPTTHYTTRMGMEIEAEDYIDKPVEPSELVKRIEVLLSK